MNKIIKKLAQQCWDRRLDGLHFDIEMFTGLVVQECVKFSINNGCGDFVDIEQKLFEHFGVES